MVRERVAHELIYLSLKFQELLSEEIRVFHVILLHDDFSATIKNIGIHLLDNEAERALISLECIEKQLELVEVLLLKHKDASCIF